MGSLLDFLYFWEGNYFFYFVRLLSVYIDFSAVVTSDLAPSTQGHPAEACADPNRGAIISGRSMVHNAHRHSLRAGAWSILHTLRPGDSGGRLQNEKAPAITLCEGKMEHAPAKEAVKS